MNKMPRRGKDNDHIKSGQLRRRGQYQIQHKMMIKIVAHALRHSQALRKVLVYLEFNRT